MARPGTAVTTPPDLPPDLEKVVPEMLKALPGAVGAVVALAWINGTRMQRSVSLIGGVAASYYGAARVASMLNVEQGLAGFLVGLFGMAIAAKLFEAIAALNLARAVDRVLRKWGIFL